MKKKLKTISIGFQTLEYYSSLMRNKNTWKRLSVSPELMVLAIGSGSLMLSHVNDAGFLLFKEYFNLSVNKTLSTWTVMETSIGISGLVGVLILNQFL